MEMIARLLAAFLFLFALLSLTPEFSAQHRALPDTLTLNQWIGQDTWTWTLTRRPNSNVFDAVARHDRTGNQSQHTFELRVWDGRNITFYRPDAGTYTGTVSADGSAIEGRTSFGGANEGWRAALNPAAAAPPGAPQASVPQAARQALEEGMALRGKGDLQGARGVFSRAIQLAPHLAEAWRQRGLVHYALKQFAEAAHDFTRAVELEPANARAWMGLGSARRSLGQASGAREAYDRAIQLDPKYSNAFMNRAGLRYENGDARGAIEDYTRAIELDPRNALAWHSRGVVRMASNDPAGAREDFSRSLESDPNHAMAAASRRALSDLGAVAKGPAPAPPASPAERQPPSPGASAPAAAAPPQSAPAVTASFEKSSIPQEMFLEGNWPASYSTAAPAGKGAPLPAAPAGPTAHIPENLDINHLAPAAYHAVVLAAKEAMRLLLGPQDAAAEQAFEMRWAPLLEYPCQPVIEYFNKLNPLLNRFLETRAALNLSILQFVDAYEEAVTAAGLGDEEGVWEAMTVARVHRESLAALDRRLIEIARAIEALGEPPDPIAHRARARKTYADAAKYVKTVFSPPGGMYWILTGLTVDPHPKRSSAEVQYTHEVAEGYAKGSTHSSFLRPGETTPRRISAIGELKWTPPPRLIPAGNDLDLRMEIGIQLRCTNVENAYGLPGGEQGDCARIFVDPASNADHHASITPASPSRDGKIRLESLRVGQFKHLLPFKVKVEIATPGGYTHQWYTYDLRRLSDAQVAELQAQADAQAAQLSQAQRTAGHRQAAQMSAIFDAQAEQEARMAAIAFAKANQQYFRERVEQYRAGAQSASGAQRDQFQYLAMVMEANLQAEIDSQTTLETGQWTRTRTAYDDWNFRFMAAQSQHAAREWSQRTAALATVPRLIAQLPQELREAQQFSTNIALEAAIARGDTAAVKKVADQLADSVKDYWTRRGQAQTHIAEVSDFALQRATELRSGADHALFALSFFGGAPVYTAYMSITGGIDAYHAPTETGEKAGVWGGITGAVRGVVASYHPAAMVAISGYDGYFQTYQDATTGKTVQGGVRGALSSAGTAAVYALAMQKVVAPLMGRFVTAVRGAAGAPPEKWPTVEQQLGEARFQSRMANGRAKVKLFQERVQLLRLARSSNDKALVAKLQQQAEEAAKAIKCDYAAKMALNQAGKADPPTLRMYLAIDGELMAQVQKGFEQNMARQGYAPVETRSYSNSASSGRAGMDVDLGIVEPPRIIRGADGRPMRNPVWDQWRRDQLYRTDASGQRRRVSLSEYQEAGQRQLQNSFDQVYGGPGRSTREGFVNFTTSQHAEAYTDMAWIGRRGLPHADFDAINPRSAQQAGDVTAFKIGHAQGQSASKIPDYLVLQENCRTLVKDMNTKLVGAGPPPPGQAPSVNPKAPLAKADKATQQHILELRRVMHEFASNDIGPLEADRRIRALTGGEGLPAVVRQYQSLLIAGVT
jgi:tetratricopeptide (TPR) repeat protein